MNDFIVRDLTRQINELRGEIDELKKVVGVLTKKRKSAPAVREDEEQERKRAKARHRENRHWAFNMRDRFGHSYYLLVDGEKEIIMHNALGESVDMKKQGVYPTLRTAILQADSEEDAQRLLGGSWVICD